MTEKWDDETVFSDRKPTYNQSIFNVPRLSPLRPASPTRGPPGTQTIIENVICTQDLPRKTSINFDHHASIVVAALVISLSHH